ncbi:hypothetical protein [Streptomyces africanus]|uniref:hypothetical protein n=1 Tax=Streptomyces africanus TaxID=231024 RepID=UPI000A3BFF66|nr:hypothetical protein [Streptomyces africanus]
MKALTVRQPYADAIAYQAKPIENRSKPLPVKYIGVPVLLHAGKEPHASGITAVDLAQLTGARTHTWPDTRSAIIAVIRFGGFHLADGDVHWCCRPWGQVPTRVQPEVWHWQITDVQHLAEPVPATGALGFWTPKEDVLAAVQRQINLERTTA